MGTNLYNFASLTLHPLSLMTQLNPLKHYRPRGTRQWTNPNWLFTQPLKLPTPQYRLDINPEIYQPIKRMPIQTDLGIRIPESPETVSEALSFP
jgi:hypothetical protein